MFAYDSDLAWPFMPVAIACAYIRRYYEQSVRHGQRWARLDGLGLMPPDPGAEVYESAEATIKTFFSTEEWEDGDDFQEPVLAYESSVTGQDWLQLTAAWGSSDQLQDWHDVPERGFPPNAYFVSTRDRLFTTWVIWRMHQLLIVETLAAAVEYDWRHNNPVPELPLR